MIGRLLALALGITIGTYAAPLTDSLNYTRGFLDAFANAPPECRYQIIVNYASQLFGDQNE